MSRPAGLTFNEATHRYHLDGRPVPGATTITNVLPKPALIPWAARVVAEYVADNPHDVAELRRAGRDELVAELRALPEKVRDAAATRGTTLHTHAEHILADRAVDVDELLVPVVRATIAFMDDWHITPVLTEFRVGHREHRYAGTGDMIAHYDNPHLGVEGVGYFDWKSGKRLYAEAALQFAAYTHAEFHGLNGDEKPVPDVDSAWAVHITPGAYTPCRFANDPSVFEDFVALRRAYEVAKKSNRRPGPRAYLMPAEPTVHVDN